MRASRRKWMSAGIALTAWASGGRLLRANAQEKVIKVVARKFVFLPNEITLKQGEAVMLEFTAPEVVMGFSVPELKLRIDIIPGQTARLPMKPEAIGTFDFLCDIFCGEGHEGMSGKLHVVA